MVTLSHAQKAAKRHYRVSDIPGSFVDHHIVNRPKALARAIVNGCSLNSARRNERGGFLRRRIHVGSPRTIKDRTRPMKKSSDRADFQAKAGGRSSQPQWRVVCLALPGRYSHHNKRPASRAARFRLQSYSLKTLEYRRAHCFLRLWAGFAENSWRQNGL